MLLTTRLPMQIATHMFSRFVKSLLLKVLKLLSSVLKSKQKLQNLTMKKEPCSWKSWESKNPV